MTEARRNLESAQHDLEAARNETLGLVRDQLKKIETAAHHYELYRDKIVPLARQTVQSNRSAYEASSAQGRVILVGVPTKSARHPSFYTLPLHFNKVLTGSEGGRCRPEIDIPKLVRLCQAGKLDFQGLVSKRYTLEQINEAIDDLKHGRVAGRCMVMMHD